MNKKYALSKFDTDCIYCNGSGVCILDNPVCRCDDFENIDDLKKELIKKKKKQKVNSPCFKYDLVL